MELQLFGLEGAANYSLGQVGLDTFLLSKN